MSERSKNYTGEYEWYTPETYLESARNVLGVIDCDPASSFEANKTVQADSYYGVDDNGLVHEWNGNVWLNPPYARNLIGKFVSKLISEYESGRTQQAILLTNSATDTRWYHDAAKASSAMCLTSGRINFVIDGKQMRNTPTGQTFFYFGANHELFSYEFHRHGLIVRPC